MVELGHSSTFVTSSLLLRPRVKIVFSPLPESVGSMKHSPAKKALMQHWSLKQSADYNAVNIVLVLVLQSPIISQSTGLKHLSTLVSSEGRACVNEAVFASI